ncbi:MAG TPA: ABC transporter ATP-binding protein [Candidatus Binatia bacterium]|nr:ABC transporter ATP-binding protein [Candidatus Binatia bacterium]
MRVTVHQLAKAYGYFWALKDLEFQITGGERVALLGPNGAGKTTLLKLLAGLIYATRGEIRFDNVPLTRTSLEDRAAIGLLAPGEHLYENLTARENLKFFTALYDKPGDPPPSQTAIDQTLEAVGLGRWADEFTRTLSSGMKFRLTIAKWTLLKPRILLLDEPYGVLDGGGVDLLETFLKKQAENGCVVMVASHHVARVLEFCSRAIILEQGKIIFDEPRRDPWDSFNRAFSAFSPGARR